MKHRGTGDVDAVIASARREREARAMGYREQALKLFPWVCGRCGRSFDRSSVRELTVHHRDHDHDNNPPDGSNWELLCLYCHDDEHARHLHAGEPPRGDARSRPAGHRPFSGLGRMLDGDKGSPEQPPGPGRGPARAPSQAADPGMGRGTGRVPRRGPGRG